MGEGGPAGRYLGPRSGGLLRSWIPGSWPSVASAGATGCLRGSASGIMVAMMRPTLSFATILTASVLCTTAASLAQAQWLVGPGGYAQISQVMPLVADGDTVLVAPGTYWQFQCLRGVTIRAVTPGTVTVAWNILGAPAPCGCTCLGSQGPVRFQPPAGATTHVVGLQFASAYFPTACFQFLHQSVQVSSGRVTFDECSIDSLRIENAIVHLQDCTVTSNFLGAGLQANAADVTIAGGSVSGTSATVSLAATPGLQLTNSRLHAAGVTVQGGAPSALGIQATGGSLWLVDATVTAGSACAVAASGLVRIDRSTLVGGGTGCLTSPTGAPLLGIDRSGPFTVGQLFQVTLASEPNALLLLFGSAGFAAPLSVPEIEQPFWIDVAGLFLADLAIATPLGQTTFSYAVPPVPQLAGLSFWLQGVGGTSFPLQTTPVVGGVVR